MKFLARFDKGQQLHVFDQVPWLNLRDKMGDSVFWIRVEDEGKRTLSQNDYIQGLARLLSEYTGNSMKKLRDTAVLNALGLEDGLEKEPVIIMGQTIRLVRSTADLKKPEGSKVIDWLIQLCDSMGVRYPPRPKATTE